MSTCRLFFERFSNVKIVLGRVSSVYGVLGRFGAHSGASGVICAAGRSLAEVQDPDAERVEAKNRELEAEIARLKPA